MKRLGIPVMMTEFGGDRQVKEFVEDHLQSYFWWQYKSFGKNWGSSNNFTFFKPNNYGGALVNPDGTINDLEIANVARTSMHKTAGTLKSMTYR